MTRDCEFCGSPAQWQFTEVVGGTKHTVYVCADCARGQGIVGQSTIVPTTETESEPQPPQMPSISIHVTSQVDPGAVPTAPRRCPGCGVSLVEIRKTGRVGCPACYATFRDHLEPLLQRVHGTVRHRATPAAAAEEREMREMQRLERELRKAIAEEDFEAAARLRDRIESRRRSPGSEDAP